MLYLAVATRAFRRYATYRSATLAGIFTNSVFGVIVSYVYLAVWDAQPHAGGYDSTDAVTFAWLGQGMIMIIAIFGGGSPDDLAARIKSGDVVIDFYRPVGLLGWYLASDLGRATYHLLTRGLMPMVLGAALFDLRFPGGPLTWLWFVLTLPLAATVSFGLRMLAALSTFWLLDDLGPRNMVNVLALFFSGMTVPLVLFPDDLREFAMASPWAAMLQLPADIWLGQRSGTAVATGFGLMIGWAFALLAACALVLRMAERRVVVQGG